MIEFGMAPICSSVPSAFSLDAQKDERNLSEGACVEEGGREGGREGERERERERERREGAIN